MQCLEQESAEAEQPVQSLLKSKLIMMNLFS